MVKKQLDQKIDIDFTLRKVFGKKFFRCASTFTRACTQTDTDTQADQCSETSSTHHLKAEMSTYKQPPALARACVSSSLQL